MSTTPMMILFDKEDRTYCANELVSGKVVLDADTNHSWHEIQIGYGWRTHGKGNSDKGDVKTLCLAKREKESQNGNPKEFPFRFNAPDGPVTYHGHIVNVDWYLKATMKISRLADISAEEDFLLVSKRFPAASTGLVEQPPVEIKKDASKSTLRLFLILALIVLTFTWGPMLVFFGFYYGYPAIGVLAVILIVLIVARIFFFQRISNLAFKWKIDLNEVKVEPAFVYPGNLARCRIQFQIKRAVYLEHIVVEILAEEHTTSGWGTRSQSTSFIAYRELYTRPYGEELAAGRQINCEFPLPVPANAAPTFRASDNSIGWNVRVKIACKRWPSWEKNFPITVSAR